MPELKTSIDIDGSPEAVWAVLSDFERYGEWNPFVRSLHGDTSVGGEIEISLELPGGRGMRFQPEVLANNKGREFRWIGRTRAVGIKLVDGEHYFLVEPADNGVRFVHGERFSGLLASPMMWLIRGQTRQGFELMNAALKARVEAAVAEHVVGETATKEAGA